MSPDWIVWTGTAIGFVAAYALGSLTSAVVASKVMAFPDPRASGSGNPGATNVLRLGGKAAAGVTLAGDVLKGAVPVAAALPFLAGWPLALVALAPVLGHMFPLYSGLRGGGKGVATAFGVFLALAPVVAMVLIATWLVVAGLFRFSSVAAMAAAVSAPAWLWLWRPEPALIALGILLAILLIARHHTNIRRLLSGEEERIGEGSRTA